MKRAISILLCLLVIVSSISYVFAASESMKNFRKIRTYAAGQFQDVPEDAWYAESVRNAYAYGLVNGSSRDTYNPDGNVTIAETLALACRIHKLYHNGNADFTQGSPWYRCYWDYAMDNKILRTEDKDYTLGSSPSEAQMTAFASAPATRAYFAALLSRALPASMLAPINQIDFGAVPDVPMQNPYASEIYLLYRAGVLTGNDKYGTFTPTTNIQRSAVAAIVYRMVGFSHRKSFTPAPSEAVVETPTLDLAFYAKDSVEHIRSGMNASNEFRVDAVYATEHTSSVNGHRRIVVFVDYTFKNVAGSYYSRQDINVYDLDTGFTTYDCMRLYYKWGYNSTPGEEDKDLYLGFEIEAMRENYTSYTKIEIS